MATRRRPLGVRSALCLVAAASAAALPSACLNRPIDRLEPRTTSTFAEPLAQSRVERIDILLAIDNSISMGDKQEILAEAVPDLVRRLITPKCIGVDTDLPTGTSADANGECGDGAEPEFERVIDINIGVISSSLGDLTTGSCDNPAQIRHPNDKAHLLSRPQESAPPFPTYQDKGFLAWDPTNQRAGESNADTLGQNLAAMVLGVEQLGCGFEMQLESVYRFLADPDPYADLVNEGGRLVEVGTDQELLGQRADFLRPDSLVAVIVLSDENDCSIDIGYQGYQDVIDTAPFYKQTDECAVDPNDRCCTSCALPNPEGCAPDPVSCGPNQGTKTAQRYATADDQLGWRCSDQKRRYGVNLLYPTKRYVNALTQARIDPSRSDLAAASGEGVENPLLFGVKDGVRVPRSPGFVYMAGIVGVPWQAIAKRDETGAPNLNLGFQSVNELVASGAFEALVGDPDANVPPTDPFMIETYQQRSGTSSLLGLSPAADNPINGGDRTFGVDDLQYACTFPLDPIPDGYDCKACTTSACDDPLCNGTTQIAAKAYPGTRELAVLRGLGEQGIPASICPEQVSDELADNYGYAPAVRTIIDKLKANLRGKCLPRQLQPDRTTGDVECLVIEARIAGEACACDPATGRSDVPTTVDGEPNPQYNAVLLAQQNEFNPGWDCFCEIDQLHGDERKRCQQEVKPDGVHGWCYVDATTVPQIGNVELVEDCPPNERRKIQFVGDADPLSGSTAFITCTGE